MQIAAITTQSITTSQTVQNNRIETVRREYTDNAGRVEVRETYYYYTVYDNKGRVNETAQPNSVDLRV
jgi:hypothetical protein